MTEKLKEKLTVAARLLPHLIETLDASLRAAKAAQRFVDLALEEERPKISRRKKAAVA